MAVEYSKQDTGDKRWTTQAQTNDGNNWEGVINSDTNLDDDGSDTFKL